MKSQRQSTCPAISSIGNILSLNVFLRGIVYAGATSRAANDLTVDR